jgi:hypothetical protein
MACKAGRTRQYPNLAALKMLWAFTGALADTISTTWNTARYACAFRLAGQKISSSIRASDLISGY